jgi:FdhD protein
MLEAGLDKHEWRAGGVIVERGTRQQSISTRNRHHPARPRWVSSTARVVGDSPHPGGGVGGRARVRAMARNQRAVDAPLYAAATTTVLRLPAGRSESDRVAVEEPLEIRVDGEPIAVTMRTPGHDEELAVGFCLTEGLPAREARLPDDLAANTVEVALEAPFDLETVRRNFYTSSSCGVCGKGALEAVAVSAPRVSGDLRVSLELVAALPAALRREQATFEATGGLHATGLFDADGELLCLREDVGRHNAMDKVIGWAYAAGLLPLAAHILCVSGRLSFELVQKAAVAGCPLLVAVGAPSSLAVDLARDRGITLCGFVRDGTANVYTEPWRLEG